MNDGEDYKDHSPGTAALTPPVSPLYNLHREHSSISAACYYSENQTTGEITDFYGYEGIRESGEVEPTPEDIDDLVSEHFRNCGVNPSSSGSANYNEMFHNQESYSFDHVANRYPIIPQVKLEFGH